jgi:hypothetical protein
LRVVGVDETCWASPGSSTRGTGVSLGLLKKPKLSLPCSLVTLSTGQSLKRPADAVLTGKRQCQPGGKQGAENQRGGHGEEVSMGEGERSGRHQRGAAESRSAAAEWRFLRSINMLENWLELRLVLWFQSVHSSKPVTT